MVGVMSLVVVLLLSASVSVAVAASDAAALNDDGQHFRAGADALTEGRYQDAIEHFEAYADREPGHPDASLNRGLAYVARIRAGAERAGDLGRAAAAFEEALMMRTDGETAQALEQVHAEVARRRSRRGQDVVQVRPTLDRIVVRWASERGWGIAAIVASFLVALGIVFRRRPPGPLNVAGTLLVPLGAVAVLILTPLFHGARYLRLNTRPGVLVVREAHLTDEDGNTLGGEAIPEAALLELSTRRAARQHVRYGSVEGWLPVGSIRTLRPR